MDFTTHAILPDWSDEIKIYHVFVCSAVEEDSSLTEVEGWLPCLDNQDKLHQYLGLTDKKPIPDPVHFQGCDPLGSACMSDGGAECSGIALKLTCSKKV